MMIQDYIDAKVSIWGDEFNYCAIGFDGDRYYAQCVMTETLRYIDETNYLDVLNEMFFDYCMHNAKWMGVS
jgi:hypothetical protein